MLKHRKGNSTRKICRAPKRKNPYRPGAQRPIGARGTKGDWRLPIGHNLQYWDVLVKKIIDSTLTLQTSTELG